MHSVMETAVGMLIRSNMERTKLVFGAGFMRISLFLVALSTHEPATTASRLCLSGSQSILITWVVARRGGGYGCLVLVGARRMLEFPKETFSGVKTRRRPSYIPVTTQKNKHGELIKGSQRVNIVNLYTANDLGARMLVERGRWRRM